MSRASIERLAALGAGPLTKAARCSIPQSVGTYSTASEEPGKKAGGVGRAWRKSEQGYWAIVSEAGGWFFLQVLFLVWS